jgi:hypothetical protein
MRDERTTYREHTPGPTWARVILWAGIIVAAYVVLAGWESELPAAARVPVAVGIVGLGVAVQTFLGGLTVLVRESMIFLHLGRVPLIRRTVPFAEIRAVESVRYHPLRDFGGWGIRGWGKRKAWAARGNQAVALELEGDRLLLIGRDRPRQLEERIRAAVGPRLNRG